jgi:hypothetical protein
MQTVHMLLVVLVIALVNHHVYSLPAINLTDATISNEMRRTLTDALVDRQDKALSSVDPRGTNTSHRSLM